MTYISGSCDVASSGRVIIARVPVPSGGTCPEMGGVLVINDANVPNADVGNKVGGWVPGLVVGWVGQCVGR